MALCLLGPLSAGIPPVALRNDALAKLRRFVPETSLRVTHAFEVMVAYGCGVWRKVDTGSGGWEHRWQPALDQLSASVLAWLRATAAWLHFDIQCAAMLLPRRFPPGEKRKLCPFSYGRASAIAGGSKQEMRTSRLTIAPRSGRRGVCVNIVCEDGIRRTWR